MSHPVVVIELFEDKFEALYSNSELSFILVNRSNENEVISISGPHAPTLEKADLSKVVNGVTILTDVLERGGGEPYL